MRGSLLGVVVAFGVMALLQVPAQGQIIYVPSPPTYYSVTFDCPDWKTASYKVNNRNEATRICSWLSGLSGQMEVTYQEMGFGCHVSYRLRTPKTQIFNSLAAAQAFERQLDFLQFRCRVAVIR